MRRVAQERSRRVLSVFENTHHGHNISAVLRTLDSFGFLDVLFLYHNPQMRFRASDSVHRGSSQWLFPQRRESLATCAQDLREQGYKIALVSLPDFSCTASSYDAGLPAFSCREFSSPAFQNILGGSPLALVFGSELVGVSESWSTHADFYVYVPMWGFSESLNVSVCAGVLLQSLRQVFCPPGAGPFLTPSDQDIVLDSWLARDYTPARVHLARYQPELMPWFEFVSQRKFLGGDLSCTTI